MLEPGYRLFCPVNAGINLPHSPRQDILSLIEVRYLRLGVAEFEVPIAKLDVPANRHPVVQIVSQQIEPLTQPTLIEEQCLLVQERLNGLLQHHSLERLVF